MKKYFEVLRKCPLFCNIADENLISMLGCLGARVESFDRKETVLAEGDKAEYVGIVLSGSVQIVRVDYFGNRSILTTAHPSELFGEAFACAGVSEIPVDIVASGKCEIMFIDCVKIICACSNACDFHRQMIYNLMRNIAAKNIMFHQKIEVTSKRSTREKLMTYLLLQAKRSNSRSFEIPYDRQELADYLEVERSGLSAEISKMRKEGIIESRKNHFELLSDINA